MRKLTKDERDDIRKDWLGEMVCERGIIHNLLDDLDAADEEIENLHCQVDHDRQRINEMACDAKQMRSEWQEMRSLLESVVDYVGEDRLSSELIHELQELGILD